MRVIAGEYRGRTLKAPKGELTRPTTDRVKESLMSSIGSHFGGFDGLMVLDAFAGSGALGIECLSRGARGCHFFERDRGALEALGANVSTLRIDPNRARVFRTDVLKAPFLAGGVGYDLVMLDPPYALDPIEVVGLIERLTRGGRIASGCLITYEHARATDLSDVLAQVNGSLDIIASKTYGKIAIDFLTIRGEQDG